MLSVLNGIQRALVLCAHTDDEFGCAGTMVRLTELGVKVRYLALSRCEESVPAGFPPDVLEHECRACVRAIGVDAEAIEVGGFPVRYFPDHRQPILERFYQLNKDYQPDVVFLPSSFDNHQDHATVYAEGFRAFKRSTLLGYELPQNVTSFENSAFVCLSDEQLKRKIDALASYQSQGFRSYAAPAYIEGLARVRGVQCGSLFAEAFEAIRVIVR